MSAHPIRIGISSCLLGEKVRYDGGHKRDGYVVRTLARHVELLPVCPEIGIGLGVPRAPIHLVRRGGGVRAVGVADPDFDVTDALARYAQTMLPALAGISGYVFKARSPSCGWQDVPVAGTRRNGRGVYADAILAAHPYLPATDEGDLDDPALRDSFLERVFAYHRWQELMTRGLSAAALTEFHAAHRLALMAHGARSAAELGRIAARPGPIEQTAGKYIAAFMRVLSQPATAARHENTLLHIMGYLEKRLDRRAQVELLDSIRRYRTNQASRAAVIKLLRRQFQHHPDPRVLRQTYLYPGNEEKRLRRL